MAAQMNTKNGSATLQLRSKTVQFTVLYIRRHAAVSVSDKLSINVASVT